MIRPYFLAGEQDVNRTTHGTLWSVEEQIDARDVLVNETDGLEFGDDPVEILPQDEQIDILGVPHGFLIDAGDPCGHGMSSHDNVGNSRLLKRPCRTTCPLSNILHGRDHPFP